MIVWRIFAGLAGLAVMGAATHANVIHAGGYGSSDANLIIAIAGLVAIGTGFAALVWHHSTKVGAIALGVCLIAGEAYWTATNTERELQTRAIAEAPTIKARAIRMELTRQVKEAEAAKKTADDEALKQAPLPGCRKECAKLLTDAKRDAETTLTAKRAELEGLPEEKITDALPDHLGVAHWVWDLIMAGLRSLGTMGGPIGIALAIHPKRHVTAAAVNVAIPTATVPIAETVMEILPPPVLAIEADAITHLKRFMLACVPRARGEEVPLTTVYRRYQRYCFDAGIVPMKILEFSEAFQRIANKHGIRTVKRGGKVYCLDVQLAA